MKALRSAASEVFGLFVEDRAFSIAIALWLAAVATLGAVHAASPSARAFGLFGGLAVILIASVVRAAKQDE